MTDPILDDVLAEVGAEEREDLAGLAGVEVREHERDGLRLLLLDEVEDLAPLHLGDVLDHVDRAAGGTDAVETHMYLDPANGVPVRKRVITTRDGKADTQEWTVTALRPM